RSKIVFISDVWSKKSWQTKLRTLGPTTSAGTRTPKVGKGLGAPAGNAGGEGREGARVAGRDRGRHDVVVEAAVLVVGDDEQRVLPVRAVDERVVELEHELLAGEDVRRRVVVVRGRLEHAVVDE